jgi:hypothetical protein
MSFIVRLSFVRKLSGGYILPLAMTLDFVCSKEHKNNRPKCQFLKLKDPYAIETLDLVRAVI